MGEILILSTVNSAELADRMARSIVEENLAACVNIVPSVRSIYRWEGKICDDTELMLLIKTVDSNFERVRKKIRSLHEYDTPEIIAFALTAGDSDYLKWLHGCSENPLAQDED
jgi:periplasmic divalent cation tolerance protein